MKRKYPPSHFLIGFVYNLIRYAPLLLAALIFLALGIFIKPCAIIGGIILGICIVLALAAQTNQVYLAKQEYDDPQINEFFDKIYGEDKLDFDEFDEYIKSISTPVGEPGQDDMQTGDK